MRENRKSRFKITRGPENQLEIRFEENEDVFDRIRSILVNRLRFREGDLLQTPDQIYLDLANDGFHLRLHWDVFAGLVLIAVNPQSEDALREVATELESIGFTIQSER